VKKVSYAKRANGNDWQKVKPVESMDMGTDAAPVACKGGVDSAPARDTKVAAETAAELAARQGRGDNNGDMALTVRVLPDADLVGGTAGTATDSSGCSSDGAGAPDDAIVSGTVGRALPNTPSRRLQRSCSNIETATPGWKAFDDVLFPAKSRSHDDLVALPAGSLLTSPKNVNGEAGGASPASSVRSTCSADRVMLKRRSSSQVLPSRSRKLWWSLFLWSHRNLHRPGAAMSSAPLPPADTNDDDACRSQQRNDDGYTSDTVDAKKNKGIAAAEEEPAIRNQWVAFSAEASASLDRVSAWVSNSLIHAEEEEDGIMEVGESSGTKGHHVQAPARRRSPAKNDAVQASSVVQTLNAFSTVAHVSGMGLKVVPMISAFSSLRAVNLSGNLIGKLHW
jgi:hypothetical protein